MTIRLLRHKTLFGAGQPAGSVLNLTDALENQLIQAGYAQALPVMTGASTGLKTLNNYGRKQFEFKPESTSSTTAAATSRYAAYIQWGAQYAARKLRLWNNHSAEVTAICSDITKSAIGDSFYNDDTWTLRTVAGNSSIAIPANDGVFDGFIDTDLISGASAAYGNGSIWAVRTYGENMSRWSIPATAQSLLTESHGFVACNKSNTDWVTTPANLNPGNATFAQFIPAVSQICYTEKQTTRVALVGGSSQLRGMEARETFGWWQIAQRLMAKDDSCFVFTNYGFIDRTTEEAYADLVHALENDLLVCDRLIWPISVTDDSVLPIWDTLGYVEYCADFAWKVIQLCQRYGIQCDLASIPVATTTVNPSYEIRLKTFDVAKSLADKKLCGYFNVFDLLMVRTSGSPSWRYSGTNHDSTHPNDAGQDLIARYAEGYYA